MDTFNIDKLEKVLRIMESQNNWVPGKRETIQNFFLTVSQIISDLSDEKLQKEYSDQIMVTTIAELFDIEATILNASANSIDGAIKNNKIKQNQHQLLNESFLSCIGNSEEFSETFHEIHVAISTHIKKKLSNLNYFYSKYSDEENEEVLKKRMISPNILIDILLNLKLYFIEEHFRSILPIFLKTNSWIIEGKTKLIKKLIKHLLKGLSKDKQIQPLSKLLLFGYSFELSKTTSDNYLRKLISLYQLKLKDWGVSITNELKFNDPPDDPRINTGINDIEIRNYFNQLTEKNTKGEQYVSNADLDYILGEFFVGFEKYHLRENYKVKTNLNQAQLRYFFYDFYYCFINTDKKVGLQIKICKILYNTFEPFKSTNPEQISKHFANNCVNYPFLRIRPHA